MKQSNKFSPEMRERAVRMVEDRRGKWPSVMGRRKVHRAQDWMHVANPERNGLSAPKSMVACVKASRAATPSE